MAKRKSKNEWLAAIHGTAGVRSEIAERLGVTSRAVRKRIDTDEEFRLVLEDEQSKVVGWAESVMFRVVREAYEGASSAAHIKACMWMLEKKARELGYGNNVKVEATVEGDGQGSVVIVLPDNGRDGYVGGSGNGTNKPS